ncbi:D-isomer specific 2-hydroxyacid dehydrogenase [Xylaria sp. FL1042]|nr:D-isomer specific 2-hydroxyacid dehydrogenase [Xylaria sp. FL1042]
MAPSALPEDTSAVAFGKPTIYGMDKFHPKVEAYLKENSNPIFPSDPRHGQWRRKAQYMLIRSARLTAEDVDSCPRLLAIGKQGSKGVLVPKETCKGLILHQRKLGLIGMGNIGKMVAQISRGASDATVIAYNPYLPAYAWSNLPHERADNIECVLRKADVISVHVPLVESTRNLIAYEQMKMMNPEAIIINTARGGIVNEADLEVAVREGLIWSAGLDCHELKPPSKEKYGGLWDLGVVSTLHIGAATDQTQMETGMAAAEKLLAFATGKSP